MTRNLDPEDLLHELGVTEPEEIDLEAIAFHCNATVRYRSLDGCEARIIGHGDHAIISIDARSSHQRQRFSIGHELGHWMRDRGTAAFVCKKADMRRRWGYRQDPESKANEFSANLLMPRFIFRPAAEGMPITFDSVFGLADRFETSNTATAIRLVGFGSYPGMVVCHGLEGRNWYTPGPDVPSVIRPHRELHHETAAFGLLFGNQDVSRSMLVDADDWIDHRDAHRYTIYEHSISVSSDTIVTLLWWKDEAQLVDLV